MNMKRQLFLSHILTLTLGGLIYIAFRTDSLIMFKWFSNLSISQPIEVIREITLPFEEYLPNWFLFSLPDGLWVFSYVSLMLLIWNVELKRNNFLWIMFAPIIAVFSEIGQALKIVSGTFDILDLIFYCIGAVAPVLIFTNYFQPTKPQTK